MELKFNNKVVRQINGLKEVKEHTLKSEGVMGYEYGESMRKSRAQQKNEEAITESFREIHTKKSMNEITHKSLFEGGQKINRMSSLYEQGKEVIFKDVFFEMYINSLYIDEDFITENYSSIKNFTDSYIDDKGGFKYLERMVESNRNANVLRDIKSLCEATAKTVTKRKTKEIDENNVNTIDFDMNQEEKDKYNKDKEELDLDKINDLVKDKVLTVIKDEKAKQENEIFSEDDKKELTESYLDKLNNTSLFNALMIESYRDIMENMALASQHIVEDEESSNDDLTDDPNLDEEDITDDEFEPITDEDILDNDDLEINMDDVLVEAISKYTLMELAHTINLENYTATSIQQLVHKLIKK